MNTDTRHQSYAARLQAFDRGWKRIFDVQRPYRWNIRRLGLGRVLDVGCGVGRNLLHLGGRSAGVGVDHSAASVELACARGLDVFTPDGFAASAHARPGSFDTLLMAHVVEHMTFEQAVALVKTYLPFVRPAGQAAFIVPQEAGFRSDATHVQFFDKVALERLAAACDLQPVRHASFPFPKVVGKLFPHNETLMIARLPG